MSLRLRIVLLALLATLAPTAIFGVYVFQDRKQAIEDAMRNLEALAAYAGKDLRDKTSGTVQLLHGLSRARDLDGADPKACSAFLGEVLTRYPQYTGLLTIRPDGQLHCDSLRSGRTLDLNDRGYFRKARDQAVPAFEAVFGRITGLAVLQVAFPASDVDGRLRYVVLASLNLAQFGESLAKASPYAGTEVVIWDGLGTVLTRNPDDGPTKLAGSASADSPLYRFVRAAKTAQTAELAGPDGKRKIWAVSAPDDASGSGLRIALGIPRELLLAKADRKMRTALALLGGVSLLAFIAALLFAERGVRRPVARIMAATKRLGAGDAGARIGAPYPSGELGALMTALDDTAASMQAQETDIERQSQQVRRANRTLLMLSGINALIVRVRDRDELFRAACRIAVEEGDFALAWLGLVDRGTKALRMVASHGGDPLFFPQLERLLKENLLSGRGAVARAIATLQPAISNDMAADPDVVLKDSALNGGARSLAILPLVVAGEAVGVLSLNARARGFFDAEEIKLLTELAGDIAFAIDHIAKRERLDFLASYDELTGIANRSLYLERLTGLLATPGNEARKLAVLVVDIERFRSINETLGRRGGDELLKQFTERTRRHMIDPDWLARIGGDQFASIVPDMAGQGAVPHLEERMSEILSAPFALDGLEVRVSVKVGISLYPDDGTDAATLLSNAEAALKKAKAVGEQYLFYAPEMTARVAANLTLENQLRQALEQEEFVLHYQPKVRLATGKVTSAEALIRWNDPRTGLVPPGQFIPILEETRLILEVGRWALHRAIADYLRWRAAGLPAVRIAVNVSPLQLRSRGFAAEIGQVVGIHENAAAGLELEITESVIMQDIQHNIECLEAIRALGVTVAIDDFGTGFSSLAYLSKLPVDTLKIDRSFVVDMTTGPSGMALVSTVIKLAHSLKLKVVAEGVETEEQSRLLRLLNCNEMQGFLFSRPVPAAEFEAKFLGAATAAAPVV
jgi:diguanylate cyclase (GGDEF)-like protein